MKIHKLLKNTISNEHISIKELNSNISKEILNYLYSQGNIVGKKVLLKKYKVPIIQLNDHTRIWMLPEELNITILNNKIL